MGDYTAHVDTFARDNLPPRDQWPDFVNLEKLGYPDVLNVASELVDRHVEEGVGHRTAVLAPGVEWSYEALAEKVNRIANVLVKDLGLVAGNRVLLRSANTPMMVAAYFAVLKAGGVVVATMPLLRAKELGFIVNKAEIDLALCDSRLADEMEKTAKAAPRLKRVVWFESEAEDGLEALMDKASDRFDACPTASDDVCLIAFTSGTTGEPKGTMHFHRDMLAICDCYSNQILRPKASDVFIGSPPLAFTFGLGGLVLFPFRVGAGTALLEKAGPDELLAGIERFKATVCFTAPTAYRAMLAKLGEADISSLRKCVSAGEALPAATWADWHDRTGLSIMDGIGATEMLHIFIAAREEDIHPGATGTPVPYYEARVIDEYGNEAPRGQPGRLAVRGPTGCRYLADPRQADYVQDGWNVTGDTYVCDRNGYFWFKARSDDMIVSAGYNIAGPEIEAALLTYPSVAECAVIGVPDAERGQVVKAYVVLAGEARGDAGLVRTLQEHVKAELAPYKYPRQVEFIDKLPKTETGKLQRFRLREMAASASVAQAS
ncbi:benzoate-CoA ligase family protein [Kaustia mangrovi]|uniref:Benzoate-CoA ligase family protein n=1 Tax=Kaustia mangrovi TaxID=2593653 RepID=A0A7S8C4F6_9HYPH|nr:benzoate-CoA ligase family protein [Kaustia mangrovi]QPC43187.1 benzoate-CoA ligase family protein [Kaustia mangrovi]